MNTYLLLEPDLAEVAEASIKKIQQRLGCKKPKIEEPFDPNINYRPTVHWRTKTHIVVCDVASSPFPDSIRDFYSDVSVKSIAVKVIIAYPLERQTDIKKYEAEKKKAKEYGIGLVSFDSGGFASIENLGVSIPLHLSPIRLSDYKQKLRSLIEEAYEAYMIDGKPEVGLQKLGQSIENIVLNLACDAKKKGNFTFNGFNPPAYIAQSKLIGELIKESVVDVGVLGMCKSFCKDRNAVSHKPKSRKEAIAIEEKIKANFNIGLRILLDLPTALTQKHYQLKP